MGMPYGAQSLLDNIRSSNGQVCLKNFCHDLLRKDSKKAFEIINDDSLHFDTLFLLRTELPETVTENRLNPLYREALRIARMLAAGNKAQVEKTIRSRRDDTVPALRWMLKTGYIERNSGAELKNYEQLMEMSAALLAKDYKDASVLPEIAEMIFARNRDGRLIHELVWAFFEARIPESLLVIARRLGSPDTADASLARRLLCFIPGLEDESISGSALYSRVFHWLEENRPFLYYTGESMHLCSMPRHYAVSLAAKYLYHPISIDQGIPLATPNEFERGLSEQFERLPEYKQQALASFSLALHRININQWNTFLKLTPDQQVNIALNQGAEGLL